MNESKRKKATRKQKTVDPMFYAGYFHDDAQIEDIEDLFHRLEQKEAQITITNGNAEEQHASAARSLFAETAQPDQLPVELWFQLQDELEKGGDASGEATDIWTPSTDTANDEYVREKSRYNAGRSIKKAASSTKHNNITTATQVVTLGSGIDLWPTYKLDTGDSLDAGPIVHESFPNRTPFVSRDEWLDKLRASQYHKVKRIDSKSVLGILGTQIDLILMDPPFGNGWNGRKLHTFLKELLPHLSRTFLVIWADPVHVPMVIEGFNRLDYVFCDSIAVELLDELHHEFYLKDPVGFQRNSRMGIMYRTNDIIRSDLKQQRVKDTGFGTIQKIGKTYGRPSMPMTIHNIVEIMLPPRKDANKKEIPRVFVELWPSFFDRRPGWILIDEEEKTVEQAQTTTTTEGETTETEEGTEDSLQFGRIESTREEEESI